MTSCDGIWAMLLMARGATGSISKVFTFARISPLRSVPIQMLPLRSPAMPLTLLSVLLPVIPNWSPIVVFQVLVFLL